ncbi:MULTISPECIES: four helix bundle protein [unclassified Leeuwenhoekiella]|uniref:four helix bundle protein n=1 Tax=unclassified Leeuwenhoekiella TaxID=2615029 RepID=UPI000C697914|nr:MULTISPECIES: four helix bundle protein [unclassified Leeuwenhoekiella]MAW94180.1 four helix bundle protein [Leeuwenhoekiella sp.]MAW96234.1 four helix bundle protein [Leeuwenhoekiella sp.]MBA80228.1 four helix bundle protein [Leeuwenhoekiella sp.]|tara:strand:+ start:17308 stop:17700 length:393 start_codon:yes stop_codon:yes gene_type:complete
MATVKRFEDLQIWQEARILAKEVVHIVQTTGLKDNYKLKDQIVGSSGSIMDNIAEGFERNGNLEFRQFLSIAKASAGETRSQLYRVFDWGYIDERQLNTLIDKSEALSKQISGFIAYLNKSDLKGTKFQS